MLRTFGRRRWLAAVAGTIGSLLVLGLPTDLVPNPIFGRQIEAPAWSYIALVITAVLAGLLLATYVRNEPATAGDVLDAPAAADQRRFTVGGLLSFLAIGCPTCNKLVVIALGSSGAISWFEPLQPVLAVAGIGLLAYALRRRLRNEVACELAPSTG
jgi:MFS family permease